MNDSSRIFEIIYNTMQQNHSTMSVKTLCAMAGVSRSGYYDWFKATSSRELREQQDRNNFELILTTYKMHGQVRSFLPLQGTEFLQADKTSSVAYNLLQRAYGPRIILLTDITYLPYNYRFP